MSLEFWILQFPVSMTFPKEWLAWAVWGCGIILIAGLLLSFKDFLFHVQRRRLGLFIILLLLQPLLSLSLVLNIQFDPASSIRAALLSGVPWVLAAGLIGPIPSTVLAVLAGIISSLWVTHNIFDPITLTLFALFVNWAVQQNYRSKFFSALRHPVLFSSAGMFLYFPLAIVTRLVFPDRTSSLFLMSGFSQLMLMMGSFSINILIAAILAELIFHSKKSKWYKPKNLIVAKLDRNSPRKFALLGILLSIALISLGLFITWQSSVKQIHSLINHQLESVISSVEDGIPTFIEQGKEIISYAISHIKANGTVNSRESLTELFSRQSYFQEISIMDKDGAVIFHFPDVITPSMTREDEARIIDPIARSTFQLYTTDYFQPDEPVLSFLSPISQPGGEIDGFILARSYMAENSQAVLLFDQLRSVLSYDGRAQLTDEFGRNIIIIHSPGDSASSPEVVNGTQEADQYDLVNTRILRDPQWRITLTIPESMILSQSRQLAIPYTLLLVVFILVLVVVFYFFIRAYYKRVVGLNNAISKSIEGKTDYVNPLDTVDEIGILGESIKSMFYQNKEAIFDQDALLRTSKAIIQMQELEAIVQPVFDALVRKGCDSVRLLLTFPGQEKQSLQGGSSSALYQHLDLAVLEAVIAQGNLIMPHVVRNRGLTIPAGLLVPGSLAAFALEQDETVIGVLWVAFQEPVTFFRDDISTIVALKDELQKSILSYLQIMELRLSQLEFESMLNVLPFGFLVIEKTGQLSFVNRPVLEIKDLIILPWNEKLYSEVIRQNEIVALIRQDNLNASINVKLENDMHMCVGLHAFGEKRIVVIRDISKEKNETRLQRDLLLTTSHDIRSPLSMIKGYISMMEVLGGINDQQQNYLEKISLATEQISQITSELLDLQRIDRDTNLKIDCFLLSELTDEISTIIVPIASQKNIRVVFSGDMTTFIRADRLLLRQAILNLMNNAIECSSLGDQIELKVAPSDQSIRFQISDQGKGIAPLDLPRLFTPGFRVNRKEENAPQYQGFGLLIVKFIAELHHGKIWAESTLGKGSTFYLEIPQTDD